MSARYVRRIRYVITCDTCTLLRIVEDPAEAQQLLDEHNAPGVCDSVPFQGGDPRRKRYDGGRSWRPMPTVSN